MFKYINAIFLFSFLVLYTFLLHKAAEDKFEIFKEVQKMAVQIDSITEQEERINNQLKDIQKSVDKLHKTK